MTDNIYCLVIISAKDDRNIAAVQFKIKLFDFFYHFKALTGYIYTDIYCKLSKCIEQRLRVRMNIILFKRKFFKSLPNYSEDIYGTRTADTFTTWS